MILGSKADTILSLRKYNLKFNIPLTFVFSVKEWKNSKKEILYQINRKFKKKIVVRSSSFDEDLEIRSNAGRYLSILDVNPKNLNKLENSIVKVIKSYKKNDFRNKLIVQDQITNVSMSGVIFTHDMVNGCPYYVINYDDNTKKTNVVTSGIGKDSNKKLIVLRNGIRSVKSERFKKLLLFVTDLEKKLKNIFLDIEFVVDKNLKIYLLQVRNISTKKKWILHTNELEKKISKDKIKLKNFFLKKKNKTILSQMSDWNPAEIIGKNPKQLSASIYSLLITDNSWAIAREQMGYCHLNQKKLMQLFSGKPFIDVRQSFLSFFPKGVSLSLRKIIVNFWIENLLKKPFLHDKIEFDVAVTCFSFDIKERLKRLLPKSINKDKIYILENLYKQLFINLLNKKHTASLENIRIKINSLQKIQGKFKLYKSVKKNKNLLNFTIKNCIRFGIIPFSQAARHGFIAKSLTDSMVKKNILSSTRAYFLQKNVHTITSEFLEDINSVVLKKFSRSDFMKKYGHLRPGAYDISSKNYKSMKNFKYKKVKLPNKKEFKLSKQEYNKLNKEIKKNNINIDPNYLIEYIIESIRLREYSKFVFTKSIDQIFKILLKINCLKTNKKDILSYFKINELRKNKINKIYYYKNIREHHINSKIFLPEVIKDNSSYDVIPYMFNVPNFITNKSVSGKVIFISSKSNHNINDKIVLIENADPGYDWIFTRKIKGLITQYGGSNSHMTIRAAELNLPSVIGCGQKKFEEIKLSNEVEINASNKTISILK